jgi:hypothetical protein
MASQVTGDFRGYSIPCFLVRLEARWKLVQNRAQVLARIQP